MKRLAAVTFLIAFAIFVSVPSTAQQSKPIPICVKIESEGGGEGQGMWAQAANDLTPRELKTLESLVLAEIKKQEGVKIVPADYPQDYISVLVVAAKLSKEGAGNWYVVSSVLAIAPKSGTDQLVTHDVIATSDIPSLARTIGFQFASARFRATTGLWK